MSNTTYDETAKTIGWVAVTTDDADIGEAAEVAARALAVAAAADFSCAVTHSNNRRCVVETNRWPAGYSERNCACKIRSSVAEDDDEDDDVEEAVAAEICARENIDCSSGFTW